MLLLLCGSAAGFTSCGGKPSATAAELRLQRTDFVIASGALRAAQGQVAAEVAAARKAWRLIADGLPREQAALELARPAIEAAVLGASKLSIPAPFRGERATALTGPAAALVGLFRSYAVLAARGWRLIAASVTAIQRGSGAASAFARDNVALYIESVYDAHFSLAQIGKKLLAGYERLGGPGAFGATLTHVDVGQLAREYSAQRERLHPHVGVRLGS